MKRSVDRILTTHTGSLPRPPNIVQQVIEGRDQRKIRAHPDFEGQVREAVFEVVRTQSAIGIDVLNDGEMSKSGFSHYITERVTGFDGQPCLQPPIKEMSTFAEYHRAIAPPVAKAFPSCNGPITWCGDEYIQQDIARLKSAVQAVAATEVFMPAVSPGQVWYNFVNRYYATDEAYIFAIADAMKQEYRAIVESGFVLQLDSPQLAMSWGRPEFVDKTFNDYRKFVELNVEAINYALDGIPSDRVRLHLCWGNSERPHMDDVPIAEFIDIVYRANADGISFEGANPRHGHEWKVFKDHPLPDGKIIIPGVIDTLTNFVEHPELVADRIERYASIVGQENVIAGTDCGFSSSVRSELRVHPTVAWAKLQALTEGAKLTTQRLWK